MSRSTKRPRHSTNRVSGETGAIQLATPAVAVIVATPVVSEPGDVAIRLLSVMAVLAEAPSVTVPVEGVQPLAMTFGEHAAAMLNVVD